MPPTNGVFVVCLRYVLNAHLLVEGSSVAAWLLLFGELGADLPRPLGRVSKKAQRVWGGEEVKERDVNLGSADTKHRRSFYLWSAQLCCLVGHTCSHCWLLTSPKEDLKKVPVITHGMT